MVHKLVLLVSLLLEVFLSPQEKEENRKDPPIHPRPTAGASHTPWRWDGKGPHSSPPVLPTGRHMLLQKQEKFFPEGKQELLLLQPWRQLKNQLAYGTLY